MKAKKTEEMYDRKIQDLMEKLEEAEEKFQEQEEENDVRLGYVASQYNNNLHDAARQGRI